MIHRIISIILSYKSTWCVKSIEKVLFPFVQPTGLQSYAPVTIANSIRHSSPSRPRVHSIRFDGSYSCFSLIRRFGERVRSAARNWCAYTRDGFARCARLCVSFCCGSLVKLRFIELAFTFGLYTSSASGSSAWRVEYFNFRLPKLMRRTWV